MRKRYNLIYETPFNDFSSYECDYSDQLLSYLKMYEIFKQSESFTIFVRMPMKDNSMILFSYDHGEFKFRDFKEEHQLIFKLLLQVFKEDVKQDPRMKKVEKLEAFEDADEIEREFLRQGDIAINDIEGSEEE